MEIYKPDWRGKQRHKRSDGMNSYLRKAQGNPIKFNADVAPFIPRPTEPPNRDEQLTFGAKFTTTTTPQPMLP